MNSSHVERCERSDHVYISALFSKGKFHTITLIIATVSFPSTIRAHQAMRLTLYSPREIYILPNTGGEVAQVTGGCNDGGKAPPSCTPRGTRRAEFNLEQPYVLWCSVHGQCSPPQNECQATIRRALSTTPSAFAREHFSLLL